jgi:hypothetical protein
MSERYNSHVHAHLDPDLLEEYPNGIRIQEIELIFTDDPDVPSWRQLTQAVCHLDARRARELAFELLTAAETAERWERAR